MRVRGGANEEHHGGLVEESVFTATSHNRYRAALEMALGAFCLLTTFQASGLTPLSRVVASAASLTIGGAGLVRFRSRVVCRHDEVLVIGTRPRRIGRTDIESVSWGWAKDWLIRGASSVVCLVLRDGRRVQLRSQRFPGRPGGPAVAARASQLAATLGVATEPPSGGARRSLGAPVTPLASDNEQPGTAATHRGADASRPVDKALRATDPSAARPTTEPPGGSEDGSTDIGTWSNQRDGTPTPSGWWSNRRRLTLIVGPAIALIIIVNVGVSVSGVIFGLRWLTNATIVMPTTVDGLSLTSDSTLTGTADAAAGISGQSGITAAYHSKTAAYGDADEFAILVKTQLPRWRSASGLADAMMQAITNGTTQAPAGMSPFFSLPTSTGHATCATEKLMATDTGQWILTFQWCARSAGQDIALVMTYPADANLGPAAVAQALTAR